MASVPARRQSSLRLLHGIERSKGKRRNPFHGRGRPKADHVGFFGMRRKRRRRSKAAANALLAVGCRPENLRRRGVLEWGLAAPQPSGRKWDAADAERGIVPTRKM